MSNVYDLNGNPIIETDISQEMVTQGIVAGIVDGDIVLPMVSTTGQTLSVGTGYFGSASWVANEHTAYNSMFTRYKELGGNAVPFFATTDQHGMGLNGNRQANNIDTDGIEFTNLNCGDTDPDAYNESTIEGYKELNLITNMEILDYSSENKKSYDEFKKVLSLYIDDMNKKMKRFEDLYRKISLYKQLVTSKVLSEKTIEFCDTGLKIINKNGRKLTDLHKLSSGEQNLLILYYNLIFKSKRNTILLIDEPENSIHVAWLSTMLNDYIKMAETTRCQIVLATHSPTFIDGKWDLCTDLYRQYKGKDTNE